MLNFFGLVHDTTIENKWGIAVNEIMVKVQSGETSFVKEYLFEFRLELERALNDPTFDWVKIASEADFTPSMPDNVDWPYNNKEGVLIEFKEIIWDFIYPDRSITQEDISLIQRTVIFLLLEVDIEVKWVYYEVVISQLRTMRPHWQFLELHHLKCLYDYSTLLDFKPYPYCYPYKKNAISLCKEDPEYDSKIEDIKNTTMKSNLHYTGWPPFQEDPSERYYLKYNKRDWLRIINEDSADEQFK